MAPKRKAAAPKEKLPVELIKQMKAKIDYGLSKGRPEAQRLKDTYANADRDGKRDLLMRYSDDPSMKWIYAYEVSVTESDATENQQQTAWYTRTQLADVEKLDEDKPEQKELLDKLCSSLPSREHEDKVWRDLGVQQYQRVLSKVIASEKTENTSQTKQMAVGQAMPTKIRKKEVADKPAGEDLQVSWVVAVQKAVSEGRPDNVRFLSSYLLDFTLVLFVVVF